MRQGDGSAPCAYPVQALPAPDRVGSQRRSEQRGLSGEPESGERRDHDVERVIGRTAVGDRVGERTDEPQKIDDRARPAVSEDQRQRVGVRRADVDEVDVDPDDLGGVGD